MQYIVTNLRTRKCLKRLRKYIQIFYIEKFKTYEVTDVKEIDSPKVTPLLFMDNQS